MRFEFCAAWAAAPLVVGCTSAVSDPASAGAGDADSARTTSAVVTVERAVDATGASRVDTSARFARVPATTSTQGALRAIGAELDLPAPGSCASITGLAEAPRAPQDAATSGAPVVELVDVGAVTLETGGRETHLVPRQLPDVTDVVSGVVYARGADPALFPSSATYTLHVGGGPEVEAFDVTATAPADPSDVHVSGDDPSTGVAVTAGAPIEVSWATGGAGDVVFIDVQPAGFRCLLDDGAGASADASHATVPASLVDDAGTLTIHRVHREPLAVHGLAGGEIRFDFSRSVAYGRH